MGDESKAGRVDITHGRSGALQGLVAASTLVLCGLLLPASSSRAECIQGDVDPGSGRPLVVCSEDDLDGFDATRSNIDVLIEEGASISNAAGLPTIRLDGFDTVTLERGTTLLNDANGQAVLSMGDNSGLSSPGDELVDDMTPAAAISVTGTGGVGVLLGGQSSVSSGARLDIGADGGTAILGGDRNTVSQTGMIDLGSASDASGIALGTLADVTLGDALLGSTTLTGTGERATGIRVGNDAVLISNNALIQLDGAFSVGIEIGDSGQVRNRSGILLGGDDSVGIRTGSNLTQGVGLRNDETIQLEGARAIGIDGGDVNVVTNGFQAAVNPSEIVVLGDDAVGVQLGNQSFLTNHGNIEATGENGVAVRLNVGGGSGSLFLNTRHIEGGAGNGLALTLAESAPGDLNIIVNQGTISVPVDMNMLPRLAVLGGDGGDSFRNEGDVTGHVDLAGGDDLFGIAPGSTIDGEIRGGLGNDAIVLTGPRQLDAPDRDAFDISRGLDFEQIDVMDGIWTLSASTGSSAGLSVVGGVARIEEPLSFGGDFFQGVDGILEIQLASGGTGGALDTAGSFTIEDGAMLRLTAGESLAPDETHRIVTSMGGIVGSFMLEPPNLAGLDLTLQSVLGGLALEVLVESSPFVDAVSRENRRALAGHLDRALAAGAPMGDFATLMGELSTLSDAAFARSADTLHPEAYDVHTATSLRLGHLFMESALRTRPRCEEVRYRYQPTIVAAAPCGEGGVHAWADAIGEYAERGADAGHVDYTRALGGLVVGADMAFGERGLVTAYLGGSHGTLDVERVGDGTISSFEMGAAVAVAVSGFQLRGGLGYGHGFHEQDRRVVAGSLLRDAKGHYDSDRFMASFEVAYPFHWEEFELGPLAGFDYTHIAEESFDESGARSANLDVDERSNDIASGHIGLRAGATLFKYRYVTEWLEWANGVWRPEVHVSWRGNLTGAERDVKAKLSGATPGSGSFEVEGQDAAEGLEVGLRTSFQPYGTGVHLDAGVDAFVGDGTLEGRARARIRVPF